MSECIIWSHTFIRFPFQTLINKVNEISLRIFSLHHLRKIFALNLADFSFWVRSLYWSIVIVEKNFTPCRHNYHRSRRYSFDFHYTLHLFFLVFTSKNWESYIKFVKDASERPHVDRRSITNTQHNFWGSIESWLNISVKLLIFIRTATEVNNFDTRFVFIAQ